MTAIPEIRPPTPGDVDILARLHIETWRQTYAHLVPESFFSDQMLERRREMWSEWIREPGDQTIRVAAIDGSVVGFASAGPARSTPAPRTTELYMIYLDSAAHGSGAGQALLDGVLGKAPAFLWVAKDNPRAQAFYLRNGFDPDGQEQVHPQAPLLIEERWVRS